MHVGGLPAFLEASWELVGFIMEIFVLSLGQSGRECCYGGNSLHILLICIDRVYYLHLILKRKSCMDTVTTDSPASLILLIS
jgi:hypothetical protein